MIRLYLILILSFTTIHTFLHDTIYVDFLNIILWVASLSLVVYSSKIILAINRISNENIQLKEKFELLEDLAWINPETGVYNDKAYYMRIREAAKAFRRNGINFSLASIEIDDFYKTDDRQLAINFAHIITENIKDTDLVFCFSCYHSSEFIILFNNSNIAEAMSTISKVISETTHNLEVEVSAGISEFQPTDSIDTIFRRVNNYKFECKKDPEQRLVYAD